MSITEIINWLSACPVLEGEPIIPNYLPSRKGWSLTVDKQTVCTDILGYRSAVRRLKITRRVTVPDSDARLAVFGHLEALSEWAAANPPDTANVRITGLPEFSSRASSGTEDFTVTLTLVSDE